MAQHESFDMSEKPSPTVAAPNAEQILDSAVVENMDNGKNRTASSSSIEEKETEYITGFKLYTVLVGVVLVAFLIMLDQTIMVTAIPSISTQFNSLKDIGWYGSAYLLST